MDKIIELLREPIIQVRLYIVGASIISVFFAVSVKPTPGETKREERIDYVNEFKVKHMSYGRMFADLQPAHIGAAQANGVAPFDDIADDSNPPSGLIPVSSCEAYEVDRLTHSHPLLVPKAELLLNQIGQAFQDSLYSKGATRYKIIATSLLRTDDSVKKLGRRNTNASKNSAHLYGTTFDITYVRYQKMDANGPDIRDGLLKAVLGEVLIDLKNRNACYVKHEVKQGCFHITVR